MSAKLFNEAREKGIPDPEPSRIHSCVNLFLDTGPFSKAVDVNGACSMVALWLLERRVLLIT